MRPTAGDTKLFDRHQLVTVCIFRVHSHTGSTSCLGGLISMTHLTLAAPAKSYNNPRTVGPGMCVAFPVFPRNTIQGCIASQSQSRPSRGQTELLRNKRDLMVDKRILQIICPCCAVVNYYEVTHNRNRGRKSCKKSGD
jgi:hypothetical protein